MFNDSDLDVFFNNLKCDYDIRKSHNARWIDQKCTPDVLCIIADCILDYISSDENVRFSSKDIWHSKFSKEQVLDIFLKPKIDNPKAKNEYDKFFQQPMELLAYSGVMGKEKNGNKNRYYVKNKNILTYISFNERKSLDFLTKYIKKVLVDSEIINIFEIFFNKQDKNSFDELKNSFERFTIKNTPINQVTECRRIFTKVLNPLSFKLKSRGTVRGKLSIHGITFDQLMYNRINFRDENTKKPKGITRNEFKPTLEELNKLNKYYIYSSNKAKRNLKKFNDVYFDGESEYIDELSNTKATHMHHIFPEAIYPNISGYIENIIALTPSQHLNRAHNNSNTQTINKDYQFLLVTTKTTKIEINLKQNEIPQIYDFNNLKEVLAVGLEDSSIYDVSDMDFPMLAKSINNYYLK